MEYRRTKDKAVTVSVIGMGTYAASGVYGPKDVGDFKRVLRRAYDLGVTLFDTAPVYGDAETLLGEVLGDVRSKVVISTKVAAGFGDELSCSPDHVVASCEASLEQLNTDHIDLYQIHFDDGKTPAEAVIGAFESLKESGKIMAYGIGHVSSERAREYVELGNVSTIMGELNAVSRKYHCKMLPLLRSGTAGYIGFSLTGRGVLTGAIEGREGMSKHDIRHMDAVFAGERLRSALRIRDRLAELGRQLGASPVQVAIGWALAGEGVLTGLIGPSTVEHLEEDLGGADLDIPPSLMGGFDAFLAEEEVRLDDALRVEVTSILSQEIREVDASSSLIYAIEGLADLDLVPEEELVPRIGTVIKLIRTGSGDVSSLEVIRKDLLGYLSTR